MRVVPGQRVRGLPAPSIGRWTDAGETTRRQSHDALGLAAPARMPPHLVLVKNNSGTDLPRFGVLGIDGTVFDHLNDGVDEAFDNRVILQGVSPQFSEGHGSRYVIALEPIAAGDSEADPPVPASIGRAVIIGATPCTLGVVDEDHMYADIDEASQFLKTRSMGSARILWKQPGTGPNKRAVVLLGGGPGVGVMFPVTVVRTGGSAGSATTQCSFTYSAFDLAGAQLGAGLTPAKRRPAAGAMSHAPDGAYGTGFYAASGAFVLFDANEVPSVEVCE